MGLKLGTRTVPWSQQQLRGPVLQGRWQRVATGSASALTPPPRGSALVALSSRPGPGCGCLHVDGQTHILVHFYESGPCLVSY